MAEVLTAVENAKSIYASAVLIYQFFEKVKNAPEERQEYLAEVQSVCRSLENLQARLDDSLNQPPGTPWPRGLRGVYPARTITVPIKPSGPSNPPGTKAVDPDYEEGDLLKRMKKYLVDLAKSLRAKPGFRGKFDRVEWFWKDQGVKDTIDTLVKLSNLIDKELSYDEYTERSQQSSILRDLRETQKKEAIEREYQARENQRKELLNWISGLDPYKRQTELRKKKDFVQAKHFFDTFEFTKWVEGRPWALRCYGDAGAGKTVLCSQVIEHLKETFKSSSQGRVLVLFLYLDYKDQEQQTISQLIRSLVVQWIMYQGTAFQSKKLTKMYQASNFGATDPDTDDMIELLKDDFKNFSRTFLVIDAWEDALDATRYDLDSSLDQLRTGTTNLSIMITSRAAEIESAVGEISCNECGDSNLSIYFHCEECETDGDDYDICQKCHDLGKSCGKTGHDELIEPYEEVPVFFKATDDEIRSYIEGIIAEQSKHGNKRQVDKRMGMKSLSSLPLARRLKEDPMLKTEIPKVIAQKSNGMYLLAHLYIDSLKHLPNVRELQNALRTLPEGLDAIYEDKLKRITSQKKANAKLARQALYWITFAHRPLSFEELQHALATTAEDPIIDANELTPEEDLVIYTIGLVTVGFENREVRIHRTFHEYLHQHREKWFPGADTDIALTLLTYMNFDDFALPIDDTHYDDLKGRLEQFPLMSYASQYWGEHVPQVCSQPAVQELCIKILSSVGNLSSCVQMAFYLNAKLSADLDVRKDVNGLHIAALYGLDPVIEDLIIKEGIHIDSIDHMFQQTSLMYACRRGHLTTVEKLLDLGASINVRSARESTALLEALVGERDVHLEIAKKLVERQDLVVNIKFIKELDRTALMIAAFFGYDEMIELLFQRADLELNLQDQEGNTALALAVSQGNATVVKLLLDRPSIKIDLPNIVGSTPLILAARSGDVNIVEKLLDHSANPLIKDLEGGGTALLRAVDAGHIAVVQTFLNRKIDVDTKDDDGRGLLHSAAFHGREGTMRLLLDAGMDKDAVGIRGQTPLHEACRSDQYNAARILLNARADRGTQDTSHRTPAVVAWQHGYIKTKRLLESLKSLPPGPASDPYPDAEDLPTWSLAKLGLIDLIKKRIADKSPRLSDTDPDTGNTAVHCAILYKKRDILTALLDAQIYLDQPNHVLRTPLHLCALNGDTKSTDLLLPYAPSLDLADKWAKTALLTAQNLEHYAIAVDLIAAGAAIDDAYRVHIDRTFFKAVELSNADVVEKLIARGADVMGFNTAGINARQVANANQDDDMIRVLERHRSDFFAYRSYTQRSEDFMSATSSPATTPQVVSPPVFGISPQGSFGSARKVEFPPRMEPAKSTSPPQPGQGPDLSKPAFRPRPRPRPSVVN